MTQEPPENVKLAILILRGEVDCGQEAKELAQQVYINFLSSQKHE